MHYDIANPILLQLNKVATLLGTSAENVARVLTHRIVASKVEVVESKLSLGRARYTREALAKVRDNHYYYYNQSTRKLSLL